MNRLLKKPFSEGVSRGGLFALSGWGDASNSKQSTVIPQLREQVKNIFDGIDQQLADLNCSASDITKLVVHCVDDAGIDQTVLSELIAQRLGADELPVLTFVAAAHLYEAKTLVAIDVYGLTRGGAKRQFMRSNENGFSQGIAQGDIVFVGGLLPTDDRGGVLYSGDIVRQSHVVLDKLDGVLEYFGAERRDIVKINNWYVGGGTAEAWAESAKVRVAYYEEPGPVATGLPVDAMIPSGSLIQTDCWIMRGKNGRGLAKEHSWPEGHWDWPMHLPFKHALKCGKFIFTGGQVSMTQDGGVLNPGDRARQVPTSMDNLKKLMASFDADLSSVIKMNAYLVSEPDPVIREHDLDVCGRYFSEPGPAVTTIPLTNLAYEGMLSEIEVIAVV